MSIKATGVKLLTTLSIAILVCQCEQRAETSSEEIAKSQFFFDMPIKKGEVVDPSKLNDLFPTEITIVKKHMSQNEIFSKMGKGGVGILEDPYFGRTPLENYFELVGFNYEQSKLRSVSLSALRLPPTKGRIRRLVKELERLLGPPLVLRDSRSNPPDKNSVILDWTHESDLLRLTIQKREGLLDMKLEYFPGPNNPAIPRVEQFLKPRPVAVKNFDVFFDGFLDKLQFLHPGDGPTPPMAVPSNEKEMLLALGRYGFLIQPESHDAVTLIRPFKDKLVLSLDKEYSKFDKKAKYQRLLDICQGRIGGFTDGATQVAAACYLAARDDQDVVDYLFLGKKVELPQGVSMACAEGIARNCKGIVMDKVLEMVASKSVFEAGEGKKILSSLPTKEQTRELRLKMDKTPNEEVRIVVLPILEGLEIKFGR